jgi:hypothetical protein
VSDKSLRDDHNKLLDKHNELIVKHDDITVLKKSLVTNDDAVYQGILGAPDREASNVEGGLVDPVTGEALALLRHKGLPRDSAPDPTV